MLRMSQIGEIRRMHAVEGWGIKTIAKRLGVSRNTVRRVLREELRCEPQQQRKNQPRPKLGPYVEVLEKILEEDEHLPAPRRRNPQQLYEELQGHGYTGALDSVRRYARRWRAERGDGDRAAFIPLTFGPGEAMQFDWSREVACIGGVETVVKAAHARLCHSRFFLVQVFPLERQEMMLEAMKGAFHFFGGVPRRTVVDNLKAAVKEILVGRERRWQDRFEGFCAHYLTQPCATQPGKGSDKGQVERQVEVARRHFFRPAPRVDSFEELNERLASQCLDFSRRTPHPEVAAKSVYGMWEEEREALLSLPPGDFECCCIEDEKKVDHYCTAAFDANRYSVPSRLVGHHVEMRGYAWEVRAFHKGCHVATHKRLFGRGAAAYDPMHYLDLLATRPQALDNGKPFAGWQLPDVFGHARDVLRHRGEGDKEFIRILLLLREWDVETVAEALGEALAAGTPRANCVENILRRSLEPPVQPAAVEEPQIPLLLTREPQADPGLYDTQLRTAAPGAAPPAEFRDTSAEHQEDGEKSGWSRRREKTK